MRFLFGGLATVAGLVLLFVASFGDPVLVHRLDAAFSSIVPGQTPVVAPTPVVTADKAPAAGGQPPPPLAAVPDQSPPAPPSVSPSQTQAASSPSPASRSSSPPPLAQTAQGPAAPSSPPADETASMRARRKALEQQLQRLQAEMAQASQSVSSLHSQAAKEQHDLDLLQEQRAAEAAQAQHDAQQAREATQQQRAADQQQRDAEAAKARHDAQQAREAAQQQRAADQQQRDAEAAQALHDAQQARDAAQAVAQALKPPAPEATPQPTQAQSQASTAAPTQIAQGAAAPDSPASGATPVQAAATSATTASAQIAQTVEPPEPLPLPPPPPPNPPRRSPPGVRASMLPSQVAARRDTTNAARFAAASPDQRPSQQVAQDGSATIDSVLDRLRHSPTGDAAQMASPEPDNAAHGPDIAARDNVPSVAPNAAAAYGQPRQIGPRARLGMARAALEAGLIEEARQDLEGAQLQLVFRPVTPTGEDRPGASRVAGDVASALSMLGAGNTDGALQYIRRAMDEGRPDGFAAPQRYGYGQPSRDAPVAEAGR